MKNNLSELKRYVNLYKTVCGVIREDDVSKIVKFYNLNLTDYEIKDAFLEIIPLTKNWLLRNI